MKKHLFISLLLTVLCGSFSVAQPLPPVAQALYDEAFLNDSAQVNFALNHGAQVLATPDGNSFYIKWFPTGAVPSATPLIVTLHGSDGYAFNDFYNWYLRAKAHGCGIVALQWFRGKGATIPNDYFTDTALYSYIDSALTRLSYPPHKALLHGFSRGSARSYAVVFLDGHGGKNYFCSVLSNSGSAQAGYPLYGQIMSGAYGTNVFAGRQWSLFCGAQDPDPVTSGCTGMSSTKTWLESQGASVGIFLQDDTLGHGGYHTVPAYMDTVLDYYLSCFNGPSAVPFMKNGTNVTKIFPNPFHDNLSIFIQGKQAGTYSFRVNNLLGETVYAGDGTGTGDITKTINTEHLAPGSYLLEIESDGVAERKIVVKN